jgi:hypothetical protein
MLVEVLGWLGMSSAASPWGGCTSRSIALLLAEMAAIDRFGIVSQLGPCLNLSWVSKSRKWSGGLDVKTEDADWVPARGSDQVSTLGYKVRV